MKRTLVKILLALVWAGTAAECAVAQTTTVTAPSGSIQMGGITLAAGSAVFVPVDAYGHAIPIHLSGGGINVPAGTTAKALGYSCAITNGGLGSCDIPDEVASSPSGFSYNVTISDTTRFGTPTSGMSYTLSKVTGITGSAFRLDLYAPAATVPTIAALTFTNGSGSPTGACVVPALYTDTNLGGLYQCVGGGWVGISGGPGGSGMNQLTGDVIAGPGTGSVSATLKTVNTSPGTCGDATHVCQIIDNGKGLVLSQAPVAITTNSLPAIGQVKAVYSDVARQSANNSLQVIADTVVDQNKKYFTSDGTPYWTAATGGYSGFGVFAEDLAFSIVQNPAKWSGPEGAAAILNITNKFVAAKGPAGQFPASVTPAGVTPSGNCSGFDQNCAYWSGVGWAMVPILCYEHYLKTGTTTCYTSNVAAIKTALLYNPRNPATHVISISTGATQSVPFSLFLEQARPSGDIGNAAVLQAIADAVMGQMATAAGDSTNATYFSTEFSQVTASIASELLDPSTSMLILGTGQDNQIDVLTSGMAVWFSKYTGQNIVSPTVQSAISNYLHTNLASLTYNGYFLNSPTPWAVQGIIPAGGGTSYANPTGCTNQMYHNGYWSLVTGMAAYAISLTHPEDVPGLLASFRDATNPAVEYYNRDHTLASANCGTAMTTNLESPQGAAWAAANLVGPTPVSAGAAVVNMYGGIVNGSVSPGGLTNPANVTSTQVFNGGTGVAIPLQGSSDSTVATVISARNTTSNASLNIGVNGTAQGTYSGVGVVTMSNADGSSPANVQAYDRVNHWTGIPSNYSYRWHSGLAGSTSTDTGFSRNGAGSVSVDGATVGDGLGTLRFTTLRSPGDVAIAPASTRRIIVGPAGFTHAINAFTDSAWTFDNGTVNSPAAHFYYGNNLNFGFDTSSAGAFGSCSGQIYRFIHNAAETGGAVVSCLDASGNYSVAGRYGGNLYTPGSSSETCSTGTFWDDANYHYVCTSTNTIKRVALSSF